MKSKLLLIVIIVSCFFTKEIKAQYGLYGFECQLFVEPNARFDAGTNFQGFYKPTRTDTLYGIPLPSNAHFPILVVFVQFYGEQTDPRGTWPQGSGPIYLDSMIATLKNTQSNNWWEKYNPYTQAISSQWLELSRGRFHAISPNGAFSVVLPKTAAEYLNAAGNDNRIADSLMHKDIWESIRQQGLSDWRPYDRWKKNSNDEFEFCDIGQGDGYVDMIYKVMKSRASFTIAAPGFNRLGSSFTGTDTVDVTNKILVDYDNGTFGSGVTIQFRGIKEQYLGSLFHEHFHRTTFPAGHVTYSRCCYGLGFDGFFSPYDMIINGYMTPRTAQFGVVNTLGDYSSRNSGTGELLKVPIDTNTNNEFFLIANRRKVSQWDRIMVGDTAVIEAYSDTSNYGKGIYIYHIEKGIDFPVGDISPQDLECADGFWEWEHGGYTYSRDIPECYQSPSPTWPYMLKKNPLYVNDNSPLYNSYPYGDGASLCYTGYSGMLVKWWGTGDNTTNYCLIGRDRIFTNNEEIFTNKENQGDRWDAWNVGYNEIFSPYSSPNTFSWNNDNTGIFIWYYSLNGDTANLKIYNTSANTPLDSILKWTPPSRPMGTKNSYVVDDSLVNIYHPKISWNHNMEPDMVRNNGKKMYIVYRALADNMNQLPGPYYVKATIEIDTNAPAEYIDTQIIGEPSYLPGDEEYEPFPLRYRVEAVDKYNDYSVPSDFATAIGLKPEGSSIDPGNGDKLISNSGLPKEYNLFQNYPNPFNPVTNIQFDLPKDGLVNLKVYDILGREVKNIVNEFKQAGSYIVSFDGNRLSSGIYFYRLESGNFVQVRRMVLIK